MKIEIKDIFREAEPIVYTKGYGTEGYPKMDFGKVMEEFNKNKEGK